MAEPQVGFKIGGEDASGDAFRSVVGKAQRAAFAMEKSFRDSVAKVNSDMARIGRSPGGAGPFDGLSKALGGLAIGPLAGVTSVAALATTMVRAVGDAINYGDELQKAGVKAGVTGRAISELAFAAKKADVDLASLSTALRVMQTNLSQAASGAKAPAETLAALGVSIEQLKALAPDRQFELLGQRISELQDPADRARAATELFGRAGAELLPLFADGAQGIQKARIEAERFGLAFSDEQLDQYAKADEALKKLKSGFDGVAGAAARAAIGVGEGFMAGLKDLFSGNFKLNSALDKVLVDEAVQAAKARNSAAASERVQYGTGFATAFAPGATAVPGFKPAAPKPEAEKRLPAPRRAEPSLEIKIEPIRPSANFLQAFEDATRTPTEQMLARNAELAAQAQVLRERGLITEMQYTERLLAITDQMMPSVEKLKDSVQEVEPYAENAARGIQSALQQFLFDPFKGGLRGMAQSIVQTFQSILAEIAAAKLANSLIGTVDKDGNLAGGIFSAGINKFFGGLFADGGNPPVGKFSVVGERGPEIIVPRSQATVYPMGALGGGGMTVAPVYNIDARGATQDLIQALPAILEANTRRTVELARAAVRDDVSRRAMR